MKSLIASFLILLLAVGMGFGWVNLRGIPLGIYDLMWFSLGFGNVLWMIVWMKTKKANEQSLLVPYFPIFLVPLLGMAANSLKLLSSIGFFDLLVFFLTGYLVTFAVIRIAELLFRKDLFDRSVKRKKVSS